MNKDNERDDPRPADDSGQIDRRVGYRRPPKQTRFKPGRSANPRGRPKGSRGLAKILREIAFEKHWVIEDGRRRERTNLELVLLSLRNHTATATPRASRAYELHEELFGPQEPLQAGGLLLLPEPPASAEEYDRLAAESHANLHEYVEQQMERHEAHVKKRNAESRR